MLTQPDHLFDNPLDLIISEKNKKLAKYFMSEGMRQEKITQILIDFFSHEIVLRDIFNHANNPEWVETRKWHKVVGKQYEKAIKSLEKLVIDNSIPTQTRETIITKDIERLKKQRDFLTLNFHNNISLAPVPASCQQMLNMQARALYEYMRRFNTTGTDMNIYDVIAELFANLYRDTAFNSDLKGLTGDLLKRNFVDNAYKLSSDKNKELEEKIKDIIS
ncbi:MAG: cytochrome P450 [Deltaproteobacteria bacterium]|nr:cytochrome P450 [Deltaproteobacteria bacterium]